MNSFSLSLDKFAIGLSLACTIHCLVLPVALIMLPTLTGSLLTDESFHRWLVLIVLPISLVALTMGCSKHRSTAVLLLGITGLALLIFAALAGHDLLGEAGEKIITVMGSILMALAHFKNHNLCKHHNCSCSE